MLDVLSDYKRELMEEIEDLPDEKTKQVLEFVCFIKHREMLSKIDPTQSYFWTPQWQEMEKEADADIKMGRIHHYNSIEEFKVKMVQK